MRRTPLRARSRLRSTSMLERRTKLAPVNRKRLARLRVLQFGAQAELCRAMPCCSCGAPPPSDPSHIKTRGAGGLDDVTVPQCRRCHDRLGREGVTTFWARVGVDPWAVIERMRDLVARRQAA